MKKSLLWCLLMVLGFIIFHSCQKNDLMYSCDKEADEWVKNSFDNVQVMTRTAWLHIQDPEFQKASYAAFPSNKKHDFWIHKLNEALTLDWSQQERDHLSLLIDFLYERPNFFDVGYYKDEKRLNDCVIFEYKWQEYAINELKWKKGVIYAILGTGEKMQTKKGAILSQRLSEESILIKTRSESGGGGKVCTCSQRQDFCDLTGEFQQACRSSVGLRCVVNPKNCGWFWNNDCDGNCSHAWIN